MYRDGMLVYKNLRTEQVGKKELDAPKEGFNFLNILIRKGDEQMNLKIAQPLEKFE